MKHIGRIRHGRWQCNICRAAWATVEGAKRAKKPCPEIPLPHGLYRREHIVYPTWSKEEPEEGREPVDALCDDGGCPCMTHACDCDVCTAKIDAPGLNVLRDDHECSGGGLLTYLERGEIVKTVPC
ncbi:hypothetical protein OG455_37535 [Kitasatospora sp. NBC_01287]|uniref:hypothetical protein n=1 Tax=Kitasatospora sp. NBC_01287 TaxID=2903573 RepID=UPI00225842D3|nr:hypothetical protein [Kitasatospora sp. NBC_01287]MCX4751145.1 hypothetical protein [Kitasatospora sp. NBC_01287]